MSTTQPIKDLKTLKSFRDYFKYEKPNPRNYALIITGLNSALRISDILHLTWGDVYDFNRQKWRTHITAREQKTGKVNRIFINEAVKKALLFYQCPVLSSEKDWIFCSKISAQKDSAGQPLSRYQAYRIIKEAAVHAGLSSSVSCHSLRKTFGYHAWKQGTPPALLMNIYNHSSYQITKRYLCIDQDDRDAVFAKIKL
ncbi:MAG: tyrosine-type recombinase/integrase [Lachnospiraceae bacterium]|nr:tyrosine-type recombinase/integrase [Lachnospiraceae bacterium]